MLTVYGIETNLNTLLFSVLACTVATVLTVYGIETKGFAELKAVEPCSRLQQCLPFTVLKQ